MKPISFTEQNGVRTAPPGQRDVQPLPVFTDGHVCISRWAASWRERLIVLFTGVLWLSVRSGSTLPPVLVTAEPVFQVAPTPEEV